MRRVAAIILAVVMPVAAYADTNPNGSSYTCAASSCAVAHKLAIDSAAGNPLVGDEWQFMSLRDHAAAGSYGRTATVYNGETLDVRLYLDNDTNPAVVKASTAHAVVVRVPPVAAASVADLSSSISWGSSQQVIDHVSLSGAQTFTLSEVKGSQATSWADSTHLAKVSGATIAPTYTKGDVVGSNATLDLTSGLYNAKFITVQLLVHMGSTTANAPTTGVTGGTVAPAVTPKPKPAPTPTPMPTPTPTPVVTPKPTPVPAPTVQVNVTQSQNQNQTQTSTGSGATASTLTPAQSQTQGLSGQGQAAVVEDSTSNDAAVQSAQTQTQNQTQAQVQPLVAPVAAQPSATVLPNTGASSTTSGTAGLVLLLITAVAYFRSRGSLNRRRHTSR